MSADEYLKDCLQLKQPSEDDDQHAKSYNRTRQCVVKYFPVKTCFTFDRPGNRDVLREMDTAQEKDLSKTFLADTKAFLSYVYKAKPKRMLHSKSINGAIFADLLQSYVKEIQSGKVHDVDDAFTVAANNENERMMEKAIEIFKEKLQSLELPMLKVKTFGDKYLEIQRVSLTVFGHKSVFNAERFIGMAKSVSIRHRPYFMKCES
ncbi:guanylate-binding protein 1-like [Mercenaria mercenaria]|uniref:guanylate-binding protein 1-like n=1 Tax=Mercenaria mercenaria TaxID=6596 RepID=UPI00234E3A68|nr:guanylate-binding protein 1-like [Mercenaria mercenaria]